MHYADESHLSIRNRVSFFSRFAPKKKDALPEINDNESEAGDRRTEGMDADVFSQPIGYIPQFPSPPKYIKVRSHGKKEKDFNRVFLAQELRGRTGVEIAQSGGRLVKNGAYKHGGKDGNAIWAMEFSKDGKHLAAGGKDYVVRVWQVLSTKEDRLSHETEEDFAGKEGESVRLNAPVFKTKTVKEYGGHEASILDLSWSKVCLCRRCHWHKLTVARTISYSLHQWIRQCGFGTLVGMNVCAVSSIATSLRLFNSILAMIDFSWPDRWTRNSGCGAYLTKVLPIGLNCPISLLQSPSLRTVKPQLQAV